METKKVLTLIFSLIFVGAFAFCLTWGIINFNKVKDGMSGIGVYTQEDINNAYNDGYDTALKDKNEYTELIAGYRDTITTLNDNISQLNSQVNNLTNNNKDYANQVNKLNEEKNNLDIENYLSQIAVLEQSSKDNTAEIERLSVAVTNLKAVNLQLQSDNENNLNTIALLNSRLTTINSQIVELNHLMQKLLNLNNLLLIMSNIYNN